MKTRIIGGRELGFFWQYFNYAKSFSAKLEPPSESLEEDSDVIGVGIISYQSRLRKTDREWKVDSDVIGVGLYLIRVACERH